MRELQILATVQLAVQNCTCTVFHSSDNFSETHMPVKVHTYAKRQDKRVIDNKSFVIRHHSLKVKKYSKIILCDTKLII